MSTVSYALRDEYVGETDLHGDGTAIVPTFLGGVIAIDGDRGFDVGEALNAGDGTITVAETDASLVNALNAYPALKVIPTPEGGGRVLSSYENSNLRDLRLELKTRGVEGSNKVNKAQAVELLVELDERAAAGDLTVNDPGTAEEELAAGEPDNPEAGATGEEN